MKYLFKNSVLVIVALFCCTCTYKPRGVLSEKQMREVLLDLHRADGVLQVVGITYTNDDRVAAYYKSVLDKYGITQAQFDSSLVWYTDNPNIFNKIYPMIVKQLEKEHDMAVAESNDANARAKYMLTVRQRLDSVMNIPKQPFPHIDFFAYKDTLVYDSVPYRLWSETDE